MTTLEGSIGILICDDHPVVRSGLRSILSYQPGFEVIGEAENGAEAIFLARKLRPDVVVMDLRMPVIDGVEAIATIRIERPDARILVLTTYETDADILRAINNGASGFILKEAPHEDLFAAVRDVAQGRSSLAPGAAARIIEQLRGEDNAVLSPREVEILRLVARGKGNKAIAEELFLSEATVKSHLYQIFNKLGANDRTSAVVVALQRGIIRLEPESLE